MGDKYYEGKPIIKKLTKVGHNGSVSEVKETTEKIIEKIRIIKNASNSIVLL
jgi:hypothetical protein